MLDKLSLWAGSKCRSRRKKLISIWEEHSLPYFGGLITGSVSELLAAIIFQILLIEIGTSKQQVMVCSISCAERFSFSQRIWLCTLPTVLSSELRDCRDRPWTPARIALSKLHLCSFLLFIFALFPILNAAFSFNKSIFLFLGKCKWMFSECTRVIIGKIVD